nr:autotransporter-associated beta strand repeat-containing protein [Pseudomonas bharatica]
MVLNGENSYSGGTTLSGGTLVLGSDSAWARVR